MENAKQPRNPNDLLIIQNIDTEDHEWQYDAIKTPLPYYIRAGETREMPFYIARHGVDKLIDKILQKQGKNHTNPLFREELLNKIVLGLKHINHIREKTPNELALEAMQRQKDSDPYEELLKKREIEREQLEKARLESAMPPAPLLQTVGAVIPTQPQITSAPVEQTSLTADATQPMLSDPARSQIYSLIASKLHMDLAHQPTREKFDSMSVDQLRSEFSSQLPELVNPQAAVIPDVPEVEPSFNASSLPQAAVIPAPINDGSVLAGLLQ